YFPTDVNHNIGILTGEISDIFVVDIDGKDGQLSFLNIIESGKDFLPKTLSARTGGGGFHMFFKYDSRIAKNKVGIFPNIDIRSNGGQVVCFPSMHPNGKRYKWITVKNGGAKDPAVAPEWFITALLRGEKPEQQTLNITGDIPTGQRNDTLYRCACKFINDGFTPKMLLDTVNAMNTERCEIPLPQSEINGIIKQAQKYGATKNLLESNMDLKMPVTIDTLLAKPKQRGNEYYKISKERDGLLGYHMGTGFNDLERKLEGLQKGLYFLGAISNVGKTTFLLNLCKSVVKANDDVHIIFFSIDDSFRKIYYRLLAMFSNKTINKAGNIGGTATENDKVELEIGKEKVNEFFERFTLLDESDGHTLEFIENTVVDMASRTDNLIVVIDNFHKIRTAGSMSSKERFTKLSEDLKALTNKHDIVTMSTVELRKLNHKSKPSPDDMKETVDMHYDADVIFMLHSDSERNEMSDNTINIDSKEYPIVDLIVSKNKNSGFKGVIEYVFRPELAKYYELDKYADQGGWI
ncbi:MAG: bifunctional DNA primase/polymerase, partial [Chlamydiia bacterium]|nr:bifunctional DNA primase/polymerase [Chlamydiia bacterium]